MLSLTVKKVDAFKFDGVAESDNTAGIVFRFSRKVKQKWVENQTSLTHSAA